MAVAVSSTEPVLYDPLARRFDPGMIRMAMLRRRMRLMDLVRATGLARSTVQQAIAGERIADSTAIAVFEVLERIAPMVVQ